MSWDEVQISATNSVTPTTTQKNGTFGRFRYIASKDLFIGVNHTADNVYFFRMPSVIQLGIKKFHGSIHNTIQPNLYDLKGRILTIPSMFNYSLLEKEISPFESALINSPVFTSMLRSSSN